MASTVAPATKTNDIASDTGSDTFPEIRSEPETRSATSRTYCWIESTRVPLRKLLSRFSHSSTYANPTRTGRRVSRLSATKSEQYAADPITPPTTRPHPRLGECPTTPTTNSGTQTVTAVTTTATRSLDSTIWLRGNGLARMWASVPSSISEPSTPVPTMSATTGNTTLRPRLTTTAGTQSFGSAPSDWL